MMTLNHGFSGYVCGRVAMPILKRYSPLSRRAMGWAFFLGAMMPDADIITRISAGRGAYFGRAWHSHRQFSHSLLGTLVEALVVAALLFGPVLWRQERRWRSYAWAVGCLWAGGVLHLVGDVVTPARPLPVFWPLDYSVGGWSHIGWFSPYLLVLFLTVLGIDVLMRGLMRAQALPQGRARDWAGAAVWLLYAAAAYRWLHYLAVSRYESSTQWADYQRSLLPDPLVAATTEGIAVLWSLISR
jgi:membrane-bound metal-dependent hydrolase YbcI (DUF457 family)